MSSPIACALLTAALLVSSFNVVPAQAEEAAYPPEESWKAAWIWGPEKVHGHLGLFRKVVDVRGGLVSAWAQVSGDDGYTLYVNGQEARRGGFWWRTTDTAELTSLLHPGRNVITARIDNAAPPGGFLMQADFFYADGSRQTVVTDPTWRFRSAEPEGEWQSPDFDDSTWERCVSEGIPPVAPWRDLPLRYLGPRTPVHLIAARFAPKAVAGKTLTVDYTVRLTEPVEGPRRVLALLRRNDRTLASVKVPLPAWPHRAGQTVRLPRIALRIPAYTGGGTASLEVGIEHSEYEDGGIQGYRVGTVDIAPRVRPKTLTDARIVRRNGVPTLFLNGRPQPAVWFFQWRPVPRDVRDFHKAGVDVVTCDVPFGWTGPDSFDYSEADATISGILDVNPHAYIVPRVWVSAPAKWLDAHPEEAVRMADGTGFVDNGWGGTRHESFASELWRHDVCDAMRRFVEHVMAAPYCDRVIGYHIGNGIYTEWHAWSAPNFPDTSEPMRRAFAEYVRARYHGSEEELRKAWGDPSATFEGIRCPTVAERLRGDVGVFRDPSRSRYVCDYYETFHQASATSLLGLCKAVKDATGGKSFTLAFYGYWPDLEWPQEGDHRALDRVLDSPYIDCLASPHSYERRKLGDDGLFRNHPGSVALHGKLFLDEGDDRTHLANDPQFTHVKDLAGSVSVLRRELGNAVTHNVGLWYMDQQERWFHDATMMRTIATARRWAKIAQCRPNKRTAQVALIAAPASDFYMAGRTSGLDKVSQKLFVSEVGELARSGATFDTYIVNDLANPKMPDYRCYIMLNAYYLTPEQREAVKRKAMRPGNTVIWFYAPGFVTDGGLSKESMADLTGIRIQTCDGPEKPTFAADDAAARPWPSEALAANLGIVSKEVGGARSIYCPRPVVPAATLRVILRSSGIHIYSSSDDPITASADFVQIHARTAGRKTIVLPAAAPVTDVFAGTRVSARARSFTVPMKAGETRLFYLGPPSLAALR